LGVVSGANECDADLNYGGSPAGDGSDNNTCLVSSSLTLNGTYDIYMNGSTYGAIQIASDGVTFDCNGSSIIGNGSVNGIFYGGASKNNVILKNCFIEDYNRNIRFKGNNNTFDNLTIGNATTQGIFCDPCTNSTFINNNFSGDVIGLRFEPDSDDNNISFNIFENKATSDGIYVLLGKNNIYSFNNFSDVNHAIRIISGDDNIFSGNIVNTTHQSSFWLNSSNNLIFSNKFYSHATTSIYLAGKDTNNNSIYENNFEDGELIIKGLSFNNKVYNNTFYNCSDFRCIVIHNSTGISIFDNSMNLASIFVEIGESAYNISVFNNFMNNSVTNYDSWNVGILGLSRYGGSSNVSIYNNTFYNIGCSGILIVKGENWNILNNSFHFSIQNNIDNKVNCAYEAPSAISISEIWKTWLGDSTESSTDNRTNKISNYSSNNITISDNTFSGFPVLLKTQGITNLTHDLTNYWFRSFQTPVYLVDRTDLYISNSWNNISTTYNETHTNPDPVVLRTILGEGYMGSTSTIKMQFQVFNNYLYFKNVNDTTTYQTNIYNLTNALIYYSNNSIAGSSNINSNDGNINITLSPNNHSYILDNFNLTEGVSRIHSPLWFSSTTSTSKHIASNLTDTINATILFSVSSCDEINSINYISNTGAYNKLITSYSCSDSIVTISNLEGIEQSSSSNELKILYKTYNPSSGDDPSSCNPVWRCTSWSLCRSSIQTRTCNDLNNCGTLAGKPTTSQSCTIYGYVNPIPKITEKIQEITKCAKCPSPTKWSDCTSGYKDRTNYECSKETNYVCRMYPERVLCRSPSIEIEKLKSYWFVIPIILGGGLVMFIIWFLWKKVDFTNFGSSAGGIFKRIWEIIIIIFKGIGIFLMILFKLIGKGLLYFYQFLLWLFEKIKVTIWNIIERFT